MNTGFLLGAISAALAVQLVGTNPAAADTGSIAASKTSYSNAADENKSNINAPALNAAEMHLTTPPESISVDPIPVIFYADKVYMSSSSYLYCTEDDKNALLGKYLGKASGEVYMDSWNIESGFRSTERGGVYSVKEYDEDFRICTFEVYDDGTYVIHFLEHLNGISVKSGKDIFGDRIHMKDNCESVYREYGDGSRKELQGLTNADCDLFIDSLYESEFIENVSGHRINYGDEVTLLFKMKDKTETRLLLYGNGYASYIAKSGSGNMLFFHMGCGGIYDKVLSAVYGV